MANISAASQRWHAADGPAETTRTTLLPFAIMLTLLIATSPWRRKQNFAGQFDIVVMAKAALLLLAVLAIFWVRGRLDPQLRRVPCAPLLIASAYFVVATMGSMFFGAMIASAALALRAALVAYIVVLILELVSPLAAITALAYAMGALTAFTALTGTFTDVGRLSGRLLAVSPNEMAFTAGFALLFLIWQVVNAQRTAIWQIAAITALGAVVLLTQSRTVTALLVLLVPLVALTGLRGRRSTLVAILLGLVPITYAALFTDVVPRFLTRGNVESAQTLESRTIAWDAALRSPTSIMEAVLGRGLSVKMLAVEGQYWNTQLLDSSWISAFVQAGLIGFTLGLVMVVYAAVAAARNTAPLRALWWALLLLLVVRSITESGLFDASSSFVAFMVVATGAAAAVGGRTPATATAPGTPDHR